MWYDGKSFVRCIVSLILQPEIDISTPSFRCSGRPITWSEAGGGLHSSVILSRSHDNGCLGQRPTCDFSSLCEVCTAPHFLASYHILPCVQQV